MIVSCHLSFSKEFLRNALRIMDPEGVERHLKHRFQRKRHYAKAV